MAEGGVAAPGLEIQRNSIRECLKRPLVKDENRYLLNNSWFKQWQEYVGYYSNLQRFISSVGEQSSQPGPIDNGPLFQCIETGEIKEGLLDELDYVLLPKDGWDMLVSWYGVVFGQQPIIRTTISVGLQMTVLQVEVFPPELRICHSKNIDKTILKKFSRADTLDFVEKEMRALFKIADEKETRLWLRHVYGASSMELLSGKNLTVQDASLNNKQILIIEEKDDDGTWPLPSKNCSLPVGTFLNKGYKLSSTSLDNKQFGNTGATMSEKYSSYVGSSQQNYHDSYNGGGNNWSNRLGLGVCGLTNLGNTCFMNSALQCMSNTPPLAQYFLDNLYWDELNTENPLGMKGEIAKAFADLVKEIWSGKCNCTTPRAFKMQVGRFAPQFSGYQQQDAQELMAFLLDGLHEDLNRIKKKPYIEVRDANGRPDEIVAKEAWENYRMRNNSIIVDIFHGLLKSTLVCPECRKVSVTFDPFCYLTLPLPVKKERQIDVCFVPLEPTSTPLRLKLTLPNAGSVGDLCDALYKFTNVPAVSMVVASVYSHKFEKTYRMEDGLSNIVDRDYIYVYEVPVASLDNPDYITLPVYLRQKRVWAGCTNESHGAYLFGQPFLVTVSRNDCKFDDLYNAILDRMQRYVRVPPPDRKWWIRKDVNSVSNGEVEMANGDDDDSPTADDSGKDEDEGIDSLEEFENGRIAEDSLRVHRLFSMQFVNAFGSSDLEKIKDDGRNIRFLSHKYVAIDWHPLAKEECYDDKLAEDVQQHESMSLSSRMMQKCHVIQLSECLELFTAKERLSKEDSWYCPSCKKHQQATKKFDLWSLPQVLVLCFKRFLYSRVLRDKIDTLVEFPPRALNMGKYIINKNHGPATYDLIGVCNHFGGMGGGHYTAFAKNKEDSKWYNFDDSSVSQAKEESVVSKAAYVLFYMRRDPKANANQPSLRIPAREIPAAAGTPDNRDNGIGGSGSSGSAGSGSGSDDDGSGGSGTVDRMDTN